MWIKLTLKGFPLLFYQFNQCPALDLKLATFYDLYQNWHFSFISDRMCLENDNNGKGFWVCSNISEPLDKRRLRNDGCHTARITPPLRITWAEIDSNGFPWFKIRHIGKKNSMTVSNTALGVASILIFVLSIKPYVEQICLRQALN